MARSLNINPIDRPATVRWLDIMKSEWVDLKSAQMDGTVSLECPSTGYWAVLVR